MASAHEHPGQRLACSAALVICLLVFQRPLRRFLGDLSEFSFKTAGLEASAKRGQVAVAAVAAAEASRGTKDGDAGPDAQPNLEDIEKVLPGKWAQRRIEGARVLWVDDRPQNNRYERQALGSPRHQDRPEHVDRDRP